MKQDRARSPIPFRQYRRAFTFVAPYWRGLLAVLTLGLFSTLVGLAQPYISRLLIDDALVRHNLHELWKIALAMIVITIVGLGVNACSTYCYTRLSAESLFQMRLAVFQHLQKLSPRYFARTKLGDIVSRINNDIGEVQRVCSDTLLSIFSNVLFLVGSVAIMIWLNPRLTLASIILLPVSILTLRYYQRRLMFQTAELRQRSANLGSFLIESIMGLRLIVTSTAEQRETERFSWHNTQFVRSLMSMQMTSFLASALPGTVLTLSTATVFLYGGRLVIENRLTLGAFVAFMAYHVKLLSPVQNLLGIYTSLLTGGVSLARVFEVLDAPVEVAEPKGAAPLSPFADEIRFDHVAFQFSPDVPVLQDISLTLRKGTFYALAGPSGAGKSTIGDLLVRFFDVQHGAITIDGRDIRSVTLHDLRSMVAVVEQTPYLFHATIRENLAYGRPGATLDEIEQAAMQAGIHRFICTLPERYETLIGERGATLSVGERQRMALARALLRDPAVLVLDEPTSALDPGSESIVTDELASNLRGRTTLVITHRLSLIEAADHVFVLEDGRIVEEGRPADLMERRGHLAQQFRASGAERAGMAVR
ncbi:ABC transporter ATP-binding protein [Granulicella arctica]|uniref:ABC transporter ATP-binding protein n=1 Tax=Granulicella arctica TaxID=940613 RepID=UPI0021E01C32|nr:ABC transporter ATP-binding protein [Granulicella arctica]